MILIKNTTEKTKYHNRLTLSEIKDGFPDCGKIISREVSRIKSELKIYGKLANRIETIGINIDLQNYMLLVLKEIYMKTDPRFKHLDRMKALQQVMRHQKYGISEEDIARAKEVPIEGLSTWNKIKKTRNGFMACCPFGTHEDNSPSFSVRNNRFICFSCQAKGDVIDFVSATETLGFAPAV